MRLGYLYVDSFPEPDYESGHIKNYVSICIVLPNKFGSVENSLHRKIRLMRHITNIVLNIIIMATNMNRNIHGFSCQRTLWICRGQRNKTCNLHYYKFYRNSQINTQSSFMFHLLMNQQPINKLIHIYSNSDTFSVIHICNINSIKLKIIFSKLDSL